ncbi:MAG: peroxide stress protein YaaA [Intestinibacter sp.]
MKIIISPAKKMNVNDDIFDYKDMPVFLDKAEELKSYIRSLSYEECKLIWKCNDKIAELNYNRFQNMDLDKRLTPAIFSYEGIQYQYMGVKVLDEDSLEYIQEHLRILSGFYGILRPFDGVVPYRLEMQAKLIKHQNKNLYDYWSDQIAEQLFSETDLIINLASKEYSKCIEKYLSKNKVSIINSKKDTYNKKIEFVTCVFGELKDDKVVEKGTIVKMARGQMVKYLAENNITSLEELKKFNSMGYKYNEARSQKDKYVFIKE